MKPKNWFLTETTEFTGTPRLFRQSQCAAAQIHELNHESKAMC